MVSQRVGFHILGPPDDQVPGVLADRAIGHGGRRPRAGDRRGSPGASASFFTPIGYQTNLMVMGPGGYFFRDYLKIGLMMTLLLWIAAMIMIPIFWPLT